MPVQNLDRFMCAIESEIRAMSMLDVLELGQRLAKTVRLEPAPTITINGVFTHGAIGAPAETLAQELATAGDLGAVHSWAITLNWVATNPADAAPVAGAWGPPPAAQAGGTCQVSGNVANRIVSVNAQKLTRDERDRCEQVLRERLPPDPLRRDANEVTAQLVEQQRSQAKLLEELKLAAVTAGTTNAAASQALAHARALLSAAQEAAAAGQTIKEALPGVRAAKDEVVANAQAVAANAPIVAQQAKEAGAAHEAATRSALAAQTSAQETATTATALAAAAMAARADAEETGKARAASAEQQKLAIEAAKAAGVAKSEIDTALAAVRTAAGDVETRRSVVDGFATSIEGYRTQITEMLSTGENRVQAAETKAKDAMLKCELAGDTVTTKAREFETEVRAAAEVYKQTLDANVAASTVASAKALKLSQDNVKAEADEVLRAWAELSGKMISERTEAHESIVAKTSAIAAAADELRLDAKDMLAKVTAGALSKVFNERKAEIEKTANGWIWALGANTFLLTGVYLFFALKLPDAGVSLGWVLARLSVGLPLLVLEWFIVQQYGKRHRGIEEYAFKNAMALSLRGYLEQVELDGVSPEGQSFVVDAVRRIYEHPLSDPPARRSAEQSLTSALVGAGERVATKLGTKTVEKAAAAAGGANEEA